MLKKLAVPFLTLALATFGCSSSTSNNGTGGSGGAAGGKGGGAGASAAGGKGGGAAGSSAAGTSGGGGAAGSSAAGTNGGGGSAAAGSGGGAAGSSAAGTNGGGGAGGAAGGHPGGGANGKPDASFMADCNVTSATGTDKLSAPVFCTNLFAYCSNITGLTLPATEKACEDLYTSSGQEHCRSYHLCWGVEGITMDGGTGKPMIHCPHTIGMGGVCTAVTDAASGN
jgi:hypothetical protein